MGDINNRIRQYMRHFFSFIKSYLIISLCFIFVAFIIKSLEIIFAPSFTDISSFEIYIRAICVTLISSSFYALCISPIYIIIKLISHKASCWITSILFSILILLEISLTIYTAHNGTLLGSEILVRPLSEMILSVQGAIGLVIPFITIIIVIVGFPIGIFFLLKRNLKVGFYIATIILILLSIPSIFFTKNLNTDNIINNNYITWKTSFFVSDCLFHINEGSVDTSIEYDKEKIKMFLSDNPDFETLDSRYPTERIDNTQDVLSQYFTTNGEKPNIVILIVESLGHEFMDRGFVPFIDSLADTGLYWENCLSTTIRSFGAIPAIIGSVCGPRGFQFGAMPEHNSLISLLKSNGYQTNAFYSGYWTFDCIYEFLKAQQIDYMSPFYDEYKTNKSKSLGSDWGYHDEILFEKAIDVIKEQNSNPSLNIFVTLSTHENINFDNEAKEKKWLDTAKDASDKNGDNIKKSFERNEMRFAGFAYTDDCIRQFFFEYSKLPEYDNTIFIITGDHSSGLLGENELSFNHVPLIIWSKLINENKKFKTIVSHNDIYPSVTKLLGNKFNIETLPTTHAIGLGLSTDKSKCRMLIVDQSHEISKIVYDGYYYDKKESAAYIIKDNLSLEKIDDITWLDDKLSLYKYIVRYTYDNNTLTNHAIYSQPKPELIVENICDTIIVCENPAKKPSEVGTNMYMLLPTTEVTAKKKFKQLKFTVDADVLVNDIVAYDNYMNITIQNWTPNISILSPQNIIKFIDADSIKQEGEYKLKLTKIYDADTIASNFVSVYVATPDNDVFWTPNTKLTVKNARVKLEGIR